jgi:hypothetical protein
MLINLLEAPLLAFVIAFFSKYTSSEIYYFGENKNIPAFLFMSVVVALFMGLIVSSEEIFKDRKILERESFLNLSRFSYLNSKVVYLFVLSGIQSLSFVLVANWILEIKDLTFSFWIILFTTSCLANIIGLIISSTFNSVATIYIIIPFILIPQLLLSGAIIHFDDLHKSLTNKTNVPIIGDIMTSRWAYEALTVETFKKNRYNSLVFEYNQRASEGDYYSGYYFPTLKTKIESCQHNQANVTNSDIKLIFNEIKNLDEKFGNSFTGNISNHNNFNLGDTLIKEVLNFIQVQEEYYQRSSRVAKRSRDSVFSAFRTEFGVKGLSDLKKQNLNTKLEEIMLNRYSAKKILELRGRLIRKLEPAFMKPNSKNGRAHFYAPVKKIGNAEMDTLWFNIIVIWLSSLILYLVLYFDLLRKGIVYLYQLKR